MTLTSIRNFYRSHYADERGKAEESPGGSDAAMGSKASKQNGGSGAESRSDIVSSSQVGQVATRSPCLHSSVDFRFCC